MRTLRTLRAPRAPRTRTSLVLGAALAALALAAVPALAAPQPDGTTAVLTTGSAGGSAVAAGDVLVAPLAPGASATFFSSSSGSSGFTCNVSQFTATVTDNPAAPGSATEQLTGQSFDQCSSNVTGVTGVESLSVDNLPYAVSVGDSAGDPAAISAGSGGPVQATAVVDSWFGTITCTYQLSGGFTGNADNTAQTLSFSNEHFTVSSGSSLCPSDGYFSAVYGPVADTSQAGSPAVYVN
jgi:hypothetical protein